MDSLDIAVSFGLVYVIAVPSVAMVALVKYLRSKPEPRISTSSAFVVWARCDTGHDGKNKRGWVSRWAAVGSGNDPDALVSIVRQEFPPDRFDLLVLPNGARP